MDALDHGKTVLGTVLGLRSRAALDEALRHLTAAHFTDTVQRALWTMCERYLDMTGGVLTRSAVEDGLRDAAPGTSLMYCTYFDTLLDFSVSPDRSGLAEFRWSVQQLRELAAERMTGETLTMAMEILQRGVRDGRKEWQGHSDARQWLLGRLAEVDRELHQADAPEGDMRIEGAQVLEEYGVRKGHVLRGTSGSIGTSVPDLDKLLGGGLERGELDLIAAWTSAGKTSFIVQLAWHAAAIQGKNVVFFTTETLRPQVRVKILARHSRLDKFGLRSGLNSRDIKAGTLTPAAEQALQAVTADFSQIAGRLYVAQVPRGATISVVESRLARITRDWPADLVILDSIQLLKAETARRSLWEESSLTLKDAKSMAATYMDGRGVPVVSPWQVSKEARKQALERGFYIVSDLAETAEAGTISDLVFSLLAPPEFTGGRDVVIQLSVLKNRDGEARFGRDRGITLDSDYATSCFTARSGNTGAGLLDMGSLGGDMDAAGFGGLGVPS